jgi:hypothetical protein
MMEFKVRVVKEHPQTKDVFPLGFETYGYKTYTDEEKVTEGFWTKIHGEGHYVEKVITPKGSFKDIVFVGVNGGVYSSDFFYRCTGRNFTEFLEKIDYEQETKNQEVSQGDA